MLPLLVRLPPTWCGRTRSGEWRLASDCGVGTTMVLSAQPRDALLDVDDDDV